MAASTERHRRADVGGRSCAAREVVPAKGGEDLKRAPADSSFRSALTSGTPAWTAAAAQLAS